MRENENNSFYKSDYENAQLAFSLWQSKQQETIDEYLIRKRKIELIHLVRQVIENELSSTDKAIIQLYWYDGKTLSETAAILGTSHSTISRRLDKINDVIYNNLKYALQYRYGKDYSSSVKVIIKNKDAIRYFPNPNDSISGRIKNLRLSQGFSLKDTCEMTGISEKRLSEIEDGHIQATAEDVRRVATAFKTSGDYIIFGKRKGDFANGFNN